MNGQPIEPLFKDNSITVVSFTTKEAAFAIPLDQVRYIEKDVKRNIQVGDLNQFNHEVITYQNQAVPLYDFSALIGSISGIEEGKRLIAILNEREADHIAWLDALEEAIRSGTAFTKATDPNKCAFGVWYNNFSTKDADLAETLKQFDTPHKHIHQLAEELISLAANDKLKALEQVAHERKTTLSQLQKLFEVARERVTNNIRPIIVFIEHNNNKIGALRLDNIQDIETYTIDQFSRDNSTEGIMKRNENDFVIEGFLRQGEKAPCMLLNCQPQ
jgi:chemotaxis signal transduction protein